MLLSSTCLHRMLHEASQTGLARNRINGNGGASMPEVSWSDNNYKLRQCTNVDGKKVQSQFQRKLKVRTSWTGEVQQKPLLIALQATQAPLQGQSLLPSSPNDVPHNTLQLACSAVFKVRNCCQLHKLLHMLGMKARCRIIKTEESHLLHLLVEPTLSMLFK
jgi:hypothetical protein